MDNEIRGKKSAFSNRPVFNKDEALAKLFTERLALDRGDLPLMSKLNYWSETTGECHCFPIFVSDKPIDIINRYSDVFPREYRELCNEVKDINNTLHNDNAMSKEKTNMAKLKIPILVYRAMMELRPDFWETGGMKWLEKNIRPLKIGNRG